VAQISGGSPKGAGGRAQQQRENNSTQDTGSQAALHAQARRLRRRFMCYVGFVARTGLMPNPSQRDPTRPQAHAQAQTTFNYITLNMPRAGEMGRVGVLPGHARPNQPLSPAHGTHYSCSLQGLQLHVRGGTAALHTSTISLSLNPSGLLGTMGRRASERLRISLQAPGTAVPLHHLFQGGRMEKRRQLAAQAVNTQPNSNHTNTIGLLYSCAHTTTQKILTRDRESRSHV